jgi:hypothetical protein
MLLTGGYRPLKIGQLLAEVLLGCAAQKRVVFAAFRQDIWHLRHKMCQKPRIYGGDRLYLCARIADPWRVSSGAGWLRC